MTLPESSAFGELRISDAVGRDRQLLKGWFGKYDGVLMWVSVVLLRRWVLRYEYMKYFFSEVIRKTRRIRKFVISCRLGG